MPMSTPPRKPDATNENPDRNPTREKGREDLPAREPAEPMTLGSGEGPTAQVNPAPGSGEPLADDTGIESSMPGHPDHDRRDQGERKAG